MDDNELDLRNIFGLLRRRLRLIVVTIVTVVGIALIGAYSVTPIYSSSALILVDPSSKNLLDPQAPLNSASADSARVDSEVELVRSDGILLQVIQNEKLTGDDEFGVSLGPIDSILTFLRLSEPEISGAGVGVNQALSKLRSAVSVQRRGLTYLISVQVRSESPEKSARLANAVTRAYIADQLASKINSALASRDILQARISQARDAIVTSEDSFDGFIAANVARITTDTGRTDIAQMQRQLQQLEANRTRTLALADDVQQYVAAGNLEAIVASLQSDALAELNRQRTELSAGLAATPAGSPAEIDLRAELERIEGTLRRTAETEIGALRQTVQQTQREEQALRETMRREVLGSSLSTNVLTQLYELQQSAELSRSQYQTLLSRSQDLEAQAALQLADSRIVSPALEPSSPSFPNKTLIVALAAIAALGLGIGLAFLYENLIGGFTSEEQVESVLQLPVAAAVPRERSIAGQESLSDLMVTSPLSIFAESVRRTRAAIEHSLRGKADGREQVSSRVIMIASTAPGEGKTTMALALARSYALSGMRTLLIDCDLRKPSIHRHLGIEPSYGLLDTLNTDDEILNLSTVISQDALTTATVILGARRSNVPTDQLLAGANFGRLIRSARNTFDAVILDTPPIGPVVDGIYIADAADVIVFVTRWANTAQSDAKRAVSRLSEARRPGTPILAVLNQQDESRSAYQRRYGGYYAETNANLPVDADHAIIRTPS